MEAPLVVPLAVPLIPPVPVAQATLPGLDALIVIEHVPFEGVADGQPPLNPGWKREVVGFQGGTTFSAFLQRQIRVHKQAGGVVDVTWVNRQVTNWSGLPWQARSVDYPPWMLMRDQEIPHWCIDWNVAETVWALRSFRPIHAEIKELKHAGQAVAKLKVLVVSNWSLFLMFPLYAAFHRARNQGSPSDNQGTMIPFLLVLLVFNLILKFAIAREVLPCMLSVCGSPRLGCFSPPFWLYGMFMAGLSLISTTDLVTNTAFVVAHLDNSATASIKVFGILDFKFFLLISWMTMLLQPAFAFAFSYAVASSWDTRNSRWFPLSSVLVPANFQSAVYRVFMGQQTHQGAAFALAAACRFQVLLWQSSSYLHQFHAGRTSGSVAYRAMMQQIYRSVIFVTLEACLFIHLKACVVEQQGLQDAVALVGACTGIITVTKTLMQDLQTIHSLREDVDVGHDRFLASTLAEQNVSLVTFPQENLVKADADHALNRWYLVGFAPAAMMLLCSLWKVVHTMSAAMQ